MCIVYVVVVIVVVVAVVQSVLNLTKISSTQATCHCHIIDLGLEQTKVFRGWISLRSNGRSWQLKFHLLYLNER